MNGEAFNVGGDEHLAHRDLVKMLVEIAGSGRYRSSSGRAEKKAIDIGSFYADSTLDARRARAGRRRSRCATASRAPSITTGSISRTMSVPGSV